MRSRGTLLALHAVAELSLLPSYILTLTQRALQLGVSRQPATPVGLCGIEPEHELGGLGSGGATRRHPSRRLSFTKYWPPLPGREVETQLTGPIRIRRFEVEQHDKAASLWSAQRHEPMNCGKSVRACDLLPVVVRHRERREPTRGDLRTGREANSR